MSVTDRVLGAPWVSRDEPELTRETLDALFANRIPCIRVRGFASAAVGTPPGGIPFHGARTQ